jgi:hypothetical protein
MWSRAQEKLLRMEVNEKQCEDLMGIVSSHTFKTKPSVGAWKSKFLVKSCCILESKSVYQIRFVVLASRNVNSLRADLVETLYFLHKLCSSSTL